MQVCAFLHNRCYRTGGGCARGPAPRGDTLAGLLGAQDVEGQQPGAALRLV